MTGWQTFVLWLVAEVFTLFGVVSAIQAWVTVRKHQGEQFAAVEKAKCFRVDDDPER